ncbi:MAG: hypothetical protein R3A79_04040 [Nannocystaceae bacterium]
MGFGSTIVDVLRRLVGISKDTPVVTLDGAAPAAQPEFEEEDDEDDEADGDELDDQPDPTVHDEWEDMQAFVARCEAEAIDLAGIDLDDPESFWGRYYAIERAPREEGAREARAKHSGFIDLHHWEWVSQYCQIKWSELVEDCDPPEIRAKPGFREAGARLRDAVRD